jgi:hypothetical protein
MSEQKEEMSKTTIQTASAVIAVMLLVAFVVYASPERPTPIQVVSPDGTWSIVVFGSTFETTGFQEATYQMYVNVQDAEGNVAASVAIGMAKNRIAAEQDFPIVFENNEVAQIGTVKRIKKSDYLP